MYEQLLSCFQRRLGLLRFRPIWLLTLTIISVLFTGTTRAVDLEQLGGVVIHKHNQSERYIADPAITVMPDGSYIASHNWHGDNPPSPRTTRVYRSTDGGQTWTFRSEVDKSKQILYSYNGDLYMLGGFNPKIRRSTDMGLTWSSPESLPSGGSDSAVSVPHIYNGRIYFANGMRLISAPLVPNLLEADWTATNELAATPSGSGSWLGGDFKRWHESQVVASPQTGVVMMPNIEDLPYSALIECNEAATTLSFDTDDFVNLPGADKKFCVFYDEVSERFWALTNPVLTEHGGYGTSRNEDLIRNAGALYSSADLRNWELEKMLLYTADIDHEGFHYYCAAVDGDDLVFVARTALTDGSYTPPRAHDGNILSFHRLENFRNPERKYALVTCTDSDKIRRVETTLNANLAPNGQFTTFSMDRPFGITQATNGDVYVGENKAGGRILRFTPEGSYVETVATEGVDFDGMPVAMTSYGDDVFFTSWGTSDRVHRLDTLTSDVSFFVTGSFGLQEPKGIVAGSDGTIYVADSGNGRISKFDAVSRDFLGNLLTGRDDVNALGIHESSNRMFFSWNGGSHTNLGRALLDTGAVQTYYNISDLGTVSGFIRYNGEYYFTDYEADTLYRLEISNSKTTNINVTFHGVSHIQPLAPIAPTIVSSPSSQVINEGSMVVLEVEVDGFPEPYLQWYYEGNPISGENDTSLSLENFTASMAGDYTVTATNSGGSSSSSPATLLVSQSISFFPQPVVRFSTEGIPLFAESDSGLPVALEVTSGPGTVQWTTLLPSGLGDIDLRATQSGDDQYAPAAPVDRTVTVESSFDYWRYGQFSAAELENLQVSGPAATPDDGLYNLMKYALGLGRYESYSHLLPSAGTQGNAYLYEYWRDPTVKDVDWLVEVSSSLSGGWHRPQNLQEMFVENVSGRERWRVLVPMGFGPQCFFRLNLLRLDEDNNLILQQDNFEDNNRSNQYLPDSAQWFQSFNNLDIVETSPDAYALENAPSSAVIRHGVSYFAPTDAPISLEVGETLTASFTVTPTSRTPDEGLTVLRVGLLHSGNSRQTTDNTSPNLTMSGYGFFVNPANQTVRTYGRSEDSGPLFSSLGSGNGWVGGSTGGLLSDITAEDAFALAQGVPYVISVEIKRLANDDVNIAYTTTDGINTASTSFVESSYLVYDFDTFAFAWGDAFGDGLVDDVIVTLASPVILADNFEDSIRSNQNLPESAQWLQSFNNLDVVETSPDAYALENAPSSAVIRHGVAYFAPTDAPVSLAAGEKIAASLSVTPTSRTPDDGLTVLRVGLLNSGNSRQTTDNMNPNLVMSGYGFFINPAAQRVRTYGRSEDSGPVFSSLGSGNGWVGGSIGGLLSDITPTGSFAMVQSTTYDITVEIERLANGDLNITYTSTDGTNTASASFVESGYVVYDFDTFAFAWGDAFGDGLIDDVIVTHEAP